MANRSWRALFTGKDYQRGRELLAQGKAKKLQEEDDGYTAVVRDDRNYHVKLICSWDDDWNAYLENMSCDCAQGEKGMSCAHMAAALFLAEESEPLIWDEAGAREPEKMPKKPGRPRKNLPESSGQTEEAEQNREPQRRDGSEGSLDALLALQQEEQRLRAGRLVEEGTAGPPEEYHYFEADRLLDGLGISDSVMRQARELLKKGDYGTFDVRTGFATMGSQEEQLAEGTLSSSAVQGDYWSKWSATVAVGPGKVEHANCSDWSCPHRRSSTSQLGHTLCKHEVAALLLMQDYLREHNIGDCSNRTGLELLYSVSGVVPDGEEAEKSARKLHLEPGLLITEYGTGVSIKATFRIGEEKLYKVGNISRTLGRIRAREAEQFGKTTLLLGRDRFAEDSLPWLDFLDAIEDEERIAIERYTRRQRGWQYYAPEPPKLGEAVELDGDRLDRFFQIACGSTVSAVIAGADRKKRKAEYVCRDQDVRLRLALRPEMNKQGQLQSILLTGEAPELIKGRKCAYYFGEGAFNRIDEERTEKLLPLLEQAKSGEIRARIGRNNLAAFYRTTLPYLKTIADVTEYGADRIQRYIPPEPEFICYFDVEGSAVLCRADVCYGAQTFFLTDLLDAEKGLAAIAPFRETEREERVLRTLLTWFHNYSLEDKLLFEDKNDESLFRFLDEGLDELLSVAEVHTTDRFQRLRIRKNTRFDVGVSVDSNLMNLDIRSEDLTREELLDVLFHYRRKRKFIRLKNGDFFKLDDNEAVERLATMLEAMHISVGEFVKGKMHLPTYRALYLDKMLEQTQDLYADRDQRFKKLVKEFKTIEDADYALPASLKEILRKYQKTGYRWLRTLDQYGFGGILADDMGLGKTLQIIAVLLAVREEERAAGEDSGSSLIVCPASLVYNWREEFRRFAPELQVSLVVGTSRERARLIDGHRGADVLVTSYDLFKRDVAEYEGKRFRFAVIDEAQYIKNHATAAARSVKLIQARTKYALTGTPIENRLSELWSIFDYLMPGFLYAYEEFRQELETPIVRSDDDDARENLRRMVAPFILRRLKGDVLKDLPEKLEEIRYAGMEEKQRRLYDGQVVRMKDKIAMQDESDFRRSRIEILAELTRIRQICCDPSLCFEDYDGASAKREACLDLLQSLADGGHKTLVFSQFTSMLALLEEDLTKAGLGFYKITGETPKEKRVQLVETFNGDDTPVFLISLKAGGTGLNLTGADAVVHYDPWWNLAVQEQATDRAHRIGQTRIVTVYKLIVKDTIEERIVEMQESKRQLAEDILSADGMGSGTFDREELLALLG